MDDEVRMNFNDVVSTLGEVLPDVEVTKAQLLEGQPQLIQTIYLRLLIEFGFSERMLESTSEDPLVAQEYPELFQEPIQTLKLLGALKKLLSEIKYSGTMGIFDLLRPEPQRTKRFLAAILNFWQFSNSHFDAVNAHLEDVQDRTNSAKEMKAEIKALAHQVETTRMSNGEDQLNDRNIKEKIEGINQDLRVLGTEVGVIEKDISSLKAAMAEIDENCNKIESELTATTTREGDLRLVAKTVDSIKEMEHKIEEFKDFRDAEIGVTKDLEKRKAEIEKRRKELCLLLEQMDELSKLRSDATAQETKFKTAQYELDMLKNEINQTENTLLLKRKNMEEISGKIKSLRMKWKKKRDTKEAERLEYQRTIEELKKHMSQEQIVIAECRQSISKSKSEQDRLATETEEQRKMLQTEYNNILEKISHEHDKLESQMAGFVKTIEELAMAKISLMKG